MANLRCKECGEVTSKSWQIVVAVLGGLVLMGAGWISNQLVASGETVIWRRNVETEVASLQSTDKQMRSDWQRDHDEVTGTVIKLQNLQQSVDAIARALNVHVPTRSEQ